MTPTWLTIVVALIGVLGTLSAGWLTGRRADRSANAERAARRYEQDLSLKRGAYAELLRTARTVDRWVASGRGPAELDGALEQLMNAASTVELLSPALASGSLPPVVERAERLVDLAGRRPATNDVIDETREEYALAIGELGHHLNAEITPPHRRG